MTFDARFGNVAPLAAVADRLAGTSASARATQINAVLPRVAFAPPADFDGLARLSCVLEASGGDRSGVATRDFWVAVASENGAPELTWSGARVEAAAAGDAALVVRAAARGVVVVDAARTDAFALGGLAVDADALLPAHGGAVAVADDADALLRVDVAVAWVDEPAGGASLALSLEAGCGNQACGALHFSAGDDRSAAAALSFRATAAHATLALNALRVVALGDVDGCWRSRDGDARDGGRGAELAVAVSDGGGLAATAALALDVRPPPAAPLRLTGAGRVVRTGEDAVARLAGLGVAGGANVAAGYGACARDEPLEVRLAAAHGAVGATFDPDHYGVAVARAKDGSLTISGNRAAVEAALSGNALGRVLQDLS